MAINFPIAPLTGNTYSYGGKTWVYNGNAWEIQLTVLTTSGVPEGSNLYFTNARVVAAISTQTLDNATFSGNVVAGNINITGTISGNGAGIVNLPYSSVTGLTTQNVLEIINLYFTNTRARLAFQAGPGLTYDAANGKFSLAGGGGGGADFTDILIYSQP